MIVRDDILYQEFTNHTEHIMPILDAYLTLRTNLPLRLGDNNNKNAHHLSLPLFLPTISKIVGKIGLIK